MQCRREYEAGIGYRQGRVKDWQATEDLYYGRVKKSLKNRFNVPMPVMSGFVDTLMSKIDEAPIIRFKPTEEADFRATQKVQALFDSTSKSEDNDFASKDLDGKKYATMYGRAIFKTWAESDPEFCFKMRVCDPYDFFVDPVGGGNLEEARFLGEDNIFKSKSELVAGANAGRYDKKNVQALINGMVENVIKDNDNLMNNKANRANALGLSNTTYNFMGEGTQRLIEQGTIVDGVRYYVLWNYETGLAIRCEPLKEVFESNLWWWVSWATHRDPHNFWSKAPADDVRPIAEVIKILANQELDNRQKRNFGQRAYDPEVFPNGAELEYRPNGLVAVKAGTSKIQQIGSGIYEFQTPELNGTIDLVNWLDNFVGQKSGVTAAAQGQADDIKVGIYQGNLQQVADRLGLYNKSYVKCHAAIARRFAWGAFEHLNKPEAVRIIGEQGAIWDELRRSEINPDVDVVVESGATEAQLSEVKKNKRIEALKTINADPKLAAIVNPKWRVEQILLAGEFDDESVRVALDTDNDGDREVLAVASEKIQEIVEGKKPKLFRGATTGFQQKILDFAVNNTDDDFELFKKLTDYSSAHDAIVQENAMRKAMKARAQQGLPMPPSSNQMAGDRLAGLGSPAPSPNMDAVLAAAGGGAPAPVQQLV